MLVTLPVGRRTKRKDNTEALSDAGEQAGREITTVNFNVSLLLIHVLILALTRVFNIEDQMPKVTVIVLES